MVDSKNPQFKVKAFEKDTEKVNDEVLGAVKGSKLVDICFIMDATGSMGSWIDQTKQNLLEIINSAKKACPDVQFYLSIIAYRDFDEGSDSIQVMPFTSDFVKTTEFLSTIVARGGDDACEDINGGFQQVLKLDWKSPTKILIHFADAPCHGPQFNNGGDNYPNPPSDMSWEQIIEDVKSLGIDYYFMRISGQTDKMTSVFKELWDGCKTSEKKGCFSIQPIEVDSAIFVKVITRSITQSITQSITSPLQNRTEKQNEKDWDWKDTAILIGTGLGVGAGGLGFVVGLVFVGFRKLLS